MQFVTLLRALGFALILGTLAFGGTIISTINPQPPSSGGGGGGDFPFSLPNTRTLFFITTSGNGGSDANDGKAPTVGGGHGPWASPGHAVNCGDVILVQPGTYSGAQFGIGGWGQVSSCPSTTGGIDGNGGVYFAILLCASNSITACQITATTGDTVHINNTPSNSNWAVEGFYASAGTNQSGTGCFLAESGTAATHHIAFINNICNQAGMCGFCTGDEGQFNTGPDQTAIIGTVSFNAAQSLGGGGNCGSGISVIPANFDSTPGTHIIVSQNFTYNNFNAPTGSVCANTGSGTFNTDGEGIILDSWGVASGYNSQAAVYNNVMWLNGSSGFQVFPQCNAPTNNNDKVQLFVFNNTVWGNYTDTNHFFNGGWAGELELNQICPNAGGGTYSITNNFFISTKQATSGGSAGFVAGAFPACNDVCTSPTRVNISNNYIWNSFAPTTTVAGRPNSDGYQGDGELTTTFPWGSGNTFNNPGFAGAFSSLPNASQPPSVAACAAFTNVVTCMNNPSGFNVAAIIASSNAPTKGYQPPSTTCTPDSFYPTYLKGVVYLQASGFTLGATLTEKAGLITKPCNM